MIRAILALFGYRIEYVCAWGTWPDRYSAIDFNMSRPIHERMSVAPPWAKRRIVKIV